MSALFIIFTAFFLSNGLFKCKETTFHCSTVTLNLFKYNGYKKQHTSNIQIEVGKVLFTITFAGCLTPEIIGDRVRKRRDNFRWKYSMISIMSIYSHSFFVQWNIENEFRRQSWDFFLIICLQSEMFYTAHARNSNFMMRKK